MKCPSCNSTIQPGAKICKYCGHLFTSLADPRVERSGNRERGTGRDDRYDDDPSYDEDDDYGGRGANAAPPSRGGRTSSRGRSPEWDESRPGADDSSEAPAYNSRGGRASDRGTVGRGGHGYDEDDEDPDADAAFDDRWSPSSRPPSQRRTTDRDLRDDRSARSSRPRSRQFDDPLDDPRAPGFLKGSAPSRDAGRGGSAPRGGRDQGYDIADGGRRPPGAPSRQGWQDAAGYPDAPRRGSFDRDDQRGYGSGSRMPPRRTPQPRPPDPMMDDSWEMSAFPSAEGHATGWTDPSAAWGIAGSEEFSAAQPGLRGPAGGRNSRNTRNRRNSGRSNGKGNAPGSDRQRTKFVALGVLLAALLVGGGVLVAPKLLSKGSPSATTPPSAFATYTPGPTPTPAANYTLFSSKRSAYMLTYPKAWSATEQPTSSGDNLDVFTAQSGMPMLRVEQATGFAGVSDTAVITGEVQNAQKIDTSATYTEDVSAATTVAIGGEQWARREFNVTSANVKYRMAILCSHHNGKGYVIVLVSAPADFAKYSSGEFKTMLASFRYIG